MIEGIHPKLNSEFIREINMVDDEPFATNGLICFNDVLKAHYLIADYFIGEGEEVIFGVKDFNILGSALGRQITGFGTFQKWNKPEEICATLFYGLVKNHAFHDANKRTALLVLLYQIDRYGKTIKAKQIEFEDLAVNVANNNLTCYEKYKSFKDKEDGNISFIADFIKSRTRIIDKKSYVVTFQELNRLLKRHDCYIEDASGNYANVFKIEKNKGIFGNKTKPKRVLQIGFPGWKKQVNGKALKELLKATNLTEENGVDSHAFFREAEPLGALIDQYSGPLKRLKDR